MYNRLDRIPTCDRRIDGRIDILPRHVRAMRTRRAVKTGECPFVRCQHFHSTNAPRLLGRRR